MLKDIKIIIFGYLHVEEIPEEYHKDIHYVYTEKKKYLDLFKFPNAICISLPNMKCLSDCDIKKLPRGLKKLNWGENTITNYGIIKLPLDLLELDIGHYNSHATIDVFEDLPRHLQLLNINIELQEDCKLHDDFLEYLPKSLKILNISL